MKNTQIRIQSTSFEINKLITTTQLFSNIKLTVSARLVLRCIVDYWNFNLSCAYPTQATIAKCTGLTEVSVGSAINELYSKGLIDKKKQRKRIYYYFTLKFLGYLNLLPKVIYTNTKKNLGNIPKNFWGNNILKENENTFFSNSQEQESTEDDEPEEEENGHLAFAKATIKFLGHRPEFAKKVKELKEMYNL